MTTYSIICHTWPCACVLWELTVTVNDHTVAACISEHASNIRDFMFNKRIVCPPPSRRFLCKHATNGPDTITRTLLPRELDPFPRDTEQEEE